MDIIIKERRRQVERKLSELNILIGSAPQSFGRKESATYSQALKFRGELESELSGLEEIK